MINAEVTKNQTENTASLMRRFTKRAQGAGIISRARKLRFFEREKSRNTNKKSALNSSKRREHYAELSKLGLLKPKKKRR